MSSNRQDPRLANYVPVAERIDKFYEAYPAGRILTTILEHNEETGFVLMRAEVYRDGEGTQPSATGHAYELKGQGHVNQTSHIENCETGCVGRALANLGFETKRGSSPVVQKSTAPAQSSQPNTKLDRDIEQALQILNKDDAWLNEKAKQYVKPGHSWRDLTADLKEKVFVWVNNKVASAAQEAR